MLPTAVRARVGRAIRAKLDAWEANALVLAVNPMHAHLLVELEAEYDRVKADAGRLKQAASHEVRDALPGRIWADGGKPILIRDRRHQAQAYAYILRHAEQGAWVWTYRDGEAVVGSR